MSTEQFITDDYVAPASGSGFTKIKDGENRFRILSSPLLLWVIWSDKKVTRLRYDVTKKPAKPQGENASVKHAWALIVWNYAEKRIEVMELDKMTLINPLLTHAKDKDWGHPKHYDVVFKKSGSGKDGTKYEFVAKPKSEPIDEIVTAFTDNPIDLEQLLVEGGNVFLQSGGSETSTTPATSTAKVVTPDNYVDGDDIPDGYKSEKGKLVKKTLPF